MGVIGLGSRYVSITPQGVPERPIPPGNPDPRRFSVRRARQVGRHLLVEVVYPDCKNYEGRKVILYRDTPITALEGMRHLDPHFTDHRDGIVPFARLEPTDEGWAAGIALCAELDTGNDMLWTRLRTAEHRLNEVRRQCERIREASGSEPSSIQNMGMAIQADIITDIVNGR
jgi:hypothetical protein